MKRRRLVAGAGLIALVGATVAGSPTQAAGNGTGSSTITTSLLSIELGPGGSLLGLDLITEEAATSNGPTPRARARLNTANVSSDAVSVLNVAGPGIEVASSSSPQTLSAPAVDLGAPAGVALPPGVVAGRVVPKPLTAAVDAAGAHAGGGASLEGVSLAGGLISSGTVATTIGSDSLTTDSSATRSVVASDLRVLDLGALLAGLGIDPAQLSLDTLSKLIAGLDLEVAGLAADETVAGAVNELSGQIGALKDVLPVSALSAQQLTTPEVPDAGTGLDPVVDTVDESLGQVQVPDVPLDTTIDTTLLPDELEQLLGGAPTVESVLATITALQAQLAGLLQGTLDALEAAPLLSISSIEVAVASKATDKVEASLANVSAKVAGVRVGELAALADLDVTDLAAPSSIAAVDTFVATIEAELGEILAEVDPGLAGIVDLTLFEKTESVTAEGATVKSVAGLTAVTTRVTPPSDLAGIIDGILGKVGLADLLSEAGLEVPTVEQAMAQLNDLVGGVTAAAVSAQQVPDVAALAQGVVVRLGTLSAASTFTPMPPTPAAVPTPAHPTGADPAVPTATPSAPAAPSAPVTTDELPRTGSSLTFLLLAFAALLIATGLGIPQWAEAAARPRGSRRTP